MGPLARTVEDAALFLDVTSTLPIPDGGFVGAQSGQGKTGQRERRQSHAAAQHFTTVQRGIHQVVYWEFKKARSSAD